MSAMEWKTLPVDALRPAAYNPRKKLKAGDKDGVWICGADHCQL